MAARLPILSSISQIRKIVAKSLHFEGGATMGFSILAKESNINRCTVAHPPQFFFFYFLDMIFILFTDANSVRVGVMT